MSFNPYQPPSSAYDGGYTSAGSGAGVSDRTVAALRKTRPWVLLIGVVGFVVSGFLLIGGLGTLGKSVGEGVAIIVVGVLCLLPAVAMVRFSQAINRLLHGGGVAELEQSIEAQATFWQITGIYTLLNLLGVVLVIIGAVTFFSVF